LRDGPEIRRQANCAGCAPRSPRIRATPKRRRAWRAAILMVQADCEGALLLAPVGFNLGVEAGQLAIVATLWLAEPALDLKLWP
jgi:hypothetical protein